MLSRDGQQGASRGGLQWQIIVWLHIYGLLHDTVMYELSAQRRDREWLSRLMKNRRVGGDFVKSALCGLYMGTLRLHYNVVLYNADSILKRSPRDSQMFFPVECVKMSADDRSLHNSSCENCTP